MQRRSALGVLYLYSPCYARWPIVFCTIGLTGIGGLIYSYRREVRSCSFDCNRQLPGALNHRTGNGWASRSLFICLEIFFVFSMPEPHRTNTFSGFIIAESLNEIHMSNNCSSLSTVVLPNGATTIGESAFEGSTSLVSMVISEGITSIGYSAFEDCTSLVSVVIPRSVITMGGSVFYGCTSLASVTVPGSVSSIEGYSFYGCTSLQSVTLLEGITSIGYSAFYGCTSLTSVRLPEGMTTLEDSVFQKCTSLFSIVLSSSITSIGCRAFSECTQLVEVTCYATVPPVLEMFDGACRNVHFEKGGILYVPMGCGEAYRSSHWGFYFDEINEMR